MVSWEYYSLYGLDEPQKTGYQAGWDNLSLLALPLARLTISAGEFCLNLAHIINITRRWVFSPKSTKKRSARTRWWVQWPWAQYSKRPLRSWGGKGKGYEMEKGNWHPPKDALNPLVHERIGQSYNIICKFFCSSVRFVFVLYVSLSVYLV